MPRKYKCLFCGKEGTGKYHRDCRKKVFDNIFISKYNAPMKDLLYKLYWVEGKTYREICELLSINVRTLMRRMRLYKIPIRTPSEAVVHQYIRNPDRRQKQAERMKINTKKYYGNGGINPAKFPESRKKNSESKKGEKNPIWKGGPKLSDARHHAKRKELGFTPLNSCFDEGEGHHVNREYVIYIPRDIHQSIKHRLDKPETMVKINRIAIHYLNPAIMPILR